LKLSLKLFEQIFRRNFQKWPFQTMSKSLTPRHLSPPKWAAHFFPAKILELFWTKSNFLKKWIILAKWIFFWKKKILLTKLKKWTKYKNLRNWIFLTMDHFEKKNEKFWQNRKFWKMYNFKKKTKIFWKKIYKMKNEITIKNCHNA